MKCNKSWTNEFMRAWLNCRSKVIRSYASNSDFMDWPIILRMQEIFFNDCYNQNMLD